MLAHEVDLLQAVRRELLVEIVGALERVGVAGSVGHDTAAEQGRSHRDEQENEQRRELSQVSLHRVVVLPPLVLTVVRLLSALRLAAVHPLRRLAEEHEIEKVFWRHELVIECESSASSSPLVEELVVGGRPAST